MRPSKLLYGAIGGVIVAIVLIVITSLPVDHTRVSIEFAAASATQAARQADQQSQAKSAAQTEIAAMQGRLQAVKDAIPGASATAIPPALVTATTSRLKIEFIGYLTESGAITAQMRVWNITNATLSVSLQNFVFFDGDAKKTYDNADTTAAAIPPGDWIPVAMKLPGVPTGHAMQMEVTMPLDPPMVFQLPPAP